MNRKFRAYAAIGLASAVLAGCNGPCQKIKTINQPIPRNGSADFSVYVAMGTSISSGFQSGGLVVHHQTHSFPYQFARQIKAEAFTIPSISADGIPRLLKVRSFSPLVISDTGRTLGQATNAIQLAAYHNMAVPGALLRDIRSSELYGRSPMFGLVVRGRGTIISEVATLTPTFITFEFGANEVLGPLLAGGGPALLTPTQFADTLRAALDSLEKVAPGVQLAMFNVPNVTSIPYCTTFPAITKDTVGVDSPLLGPGGARLVPGDFVLLSASDSLAAGTGFAVNTRSYLSNRRGNGRPLPASMVLTAAEAATLQAAVAAYNTAIDTTAKRRGAALVDLNGLLARIARDGIEINGSSYTSDFLTGGMFSLDGVHPTDLAHGVLCNALIDAVNARFGASIPRLNLSEAATLSAESLGPRARAARVIPAIRSAESFYREMFRGGAPAP